MAFKDFLSTIKKATESYQFSYYFIRTRKYKSPDERILFEKFHAKQRADMVKHINSENKEENELKKSPEFKIYEHFWRIAYFNRFHDRNSLMNHHSFDTLTNKAHWTNSVFFNPPFYDSSYFKFSTLKKICALLLSLLAMKLGFEHGKKDSELLDPINEYLVDIRTEDEIFRILEDYEKPLCLLYYSPGSPNFLKMQYSLANVAGRNQGTFIAGKVNCKYNFDLCLKKSSYLKMPQIELVFPKQEEITEKGKLLEKFPVIASVNDISQEGVEAFLISNGVITDPMSPMRKLVQLTNLKQ